MLDAIAANMYAVRSRFLSFLLLSAIAVASESTIEATDSENSIAPEDDGNSSPWVIRSSSSSSSSSFCSTGLNSRRCCCECCCCCLCELFSAPMHTSRLLHLRLPTLRMLLQLLLQTLLTTCSLQAIVALMRQGINNNGIATPALLLSLLLLLLFLLDTKLHDDNCRPQIVCNGCSHPTTITILKLLSLPVRPPQLPEHNFLTTSAPP